MTSVLGQIALTVDIKVSGQWFRTKESYDYYSVSRRLTDCICNGESESGWQDHYEVQIDSVSYYIPTKYAVKILDTTPINTQNPEESFMENWTDQTTNYFQAYKSRLQIDIRHGAFQVNIEEKDPQLNFDATDSEDESSTD